MINQSLGLQEHSTGLILSGLIHIAVLTASVVGIPFLSRELPDVPEPISVEIITEVDDETRAPDPQPVEREESTPAARPEAHPQVAENTVTENAVPMPDATPQPKPEIQQEERRTIPSVTPQAKPTPPSLLDTNRIVALIDRSQKEQQETPPPVDNQEVLEEAIERNRMTALEARRATASLRAIIAQQVERCWSVPVGAAEAENLIVRLQIYLNRDGGLAGPPVYLDRERMYKPGEEFFTAAAESASRAVRQCAPFDLPAEQYDLWREIEFVFDPSQMITG